MANLLFIDDDPEISAINKKYFTKQGHTVKIGSNGVECLQLLKKYTPDCILLDIMMPEMDGFTTCEEIKSISSAPIIFLSGRTSEEDKIKGLMLGADDYVVKPYSFKELSARIQVQLRRNRNIVNTTILAYPPLTLDVIAHKAFHNDAEIYLSKREYELLYHLVSHPNQTITFEEIGKVMWEHYSETDRRTIMVTASRLRKKFEDYPGLTNIIETVWSKGYKFIAK